MSAPLTCSQYSAVAFQSSQSGVRLSDVHATLDSNNGPRRRNGVLQYGAVAVRDVSPTLTGNYGKQVDNSDIALGPNVVFPNARVRRLTPLECERLQGFPDRHTAIPTAKDGPRYKALGNSMAVPVMRWIGRSIDYAMIWSTP